MYGINKTGDKNENYRFLLAAIKDLLATETDETANLATISAFMNAYISDINWVGFYIMRGGELVVGPYQGKPACIRITPPNGVCGTAVAKRETIVVPDVHSFPGHIACDSDTNSEIVCPLFKNEQVYGVLDIDSPKHNRFDETDVKNITEIAKMISEFLSK